ncbi:hypothetical protein TRFO_24993 [Tritrichomonas foetus]|uniref:Leucine Rich Repeat family protein n=1 Tax=Tritrichomonas foetus TaxID=1144522 RepID=A0A1J4K605_9EUKA|nr:hypothetical protein TRFO_24993 [Tritrichomonas foetus]|eukprot:OHT06889.1 hypothetical protein TRFO_24993 [Tritrichomonas foetus]
MDSSIKQKELTKLELQSYANGGKTRSEAIYDFSRIHRKEYSMILTALKKYGIKHLTKLGFSLDLYYESYKSEFPSLRQQEGTKVIRSVKPRVEPSILSESAYRKIPNAVDLLLDALDYILANSITMESLTFRSFQLTKAQIERLSNSIEKNSSLTSLTFDNVTLFDEGFSILVRRLHRPGLKALHFKNCGLTDASIDFIKSILHYHVSLQREAEWKASLEIDGIVDTICLTTLDVQYNLFSVRLLMEIADILADMPLTLLDIRNNQPMDEQIASNIRKNIPHVCIKTKAKSLHRRRKMKNTTKRKSATFSNDDLEESTHELIMPQFQFNRPPSAGSTGTAKSEEILLTKGVTVIGKRANEFSQYIQDLCSFADEIMRAQRNSTLVHPKKRRAQSVTRKSRK